MGVCGGTCLFIFLPIDQELTCTLSLSQAHVEATSKNPFASKSATFLATPGLRSEVIHVNYTSFT